jgi:acyl carrier protein
MNSPEVHVGIKNALLEFLGSDDFYADTSLIDAGVDSLIAIDIRKRLADTLNFPIPATLAFDYPSLGDITAYLSSMVTAQDDAPEKKGHGRQDHDKVQFQDHSYAHHERHGFLPETSLNAFSDRQLLQTIISDTLMSLLGDEDLHVDMSLIEAGVDSLIAVDVRRALADALRLQLPATLIFDYPTISELTANISSLPNPAAFANTDSRHSKKTEQLDGSHELSS